MCALYNCNKTSSNEVFNAYKANFPAQEIKVHSVRIKQGLSTAVVMNLVYVAPLHEKK